MVSEPKKGPSVRLIVTALLLLAVSAGVGAFVPIALCPACDGTGTSKAIRDNSKGGIIGAKLGACPPCSGRGKVTLLGKLRVPSIDPSLLPTPPALPK